VATSFFVCLFFNPCHILVLQWQMTPSFHYLQVMSECLQVTTECWGPYHFTSQLLLKNNWDLLRGTGLAIKELQKIKSLHGVRQSWLELWPEGWAPLQITGPPCFQGELIKAFPFELVPQDAQAHSRPAHPDFHIRNVYLSQKHPDKQLQASTFTSVYLYILLCNSPSLTAL
jgi:hypothetical protein